MNHEEFKRGWKGGLPETPCGSGSKLRNTAIQRKWIPEMVAKYNIQSIADVGAGDLNWASLTTFGCDYAPFDLVPRAEGVIKLDILADELPEAECLMVLWVLNHMTKAQASMAVSKIMNSKSRYLIATYREDFYGTFDATILESVKICNDAELRLYEL